MLKISSLTRRTRPVGVHTGIRSLDGAISAAMAMTWIIKDVEVRLVSKDRCTFTIRPLINQSSQRKSKKLKIKLKRDKGMTVILIEDRMCILKTK